MTTTPSRVPAPVTLTVPGAGTLTITHTPGPDGTAHADVRLTVVLPDDPERAVLRLTALATHLRALIGPARRAG